MVRPARYRIGRATRSWAPVSSTHSAPNDFLCRYRPYAGSLGGGGPVSPPVVDPGFGPDEPMALAASVGGPRVYVVGGGFGVVARLYG